MMMLCIAIHSNALNEELDNHLWCKHTCNVKDLPRIISDMKDKISTLFPFISQYTHRCIRSTKYLLFYFNSTPVTNRIFTLCFVVQYPTFNTHKCLQCNIWTMLRIYVQFHRVLPWCSAIHSLRVVLSTGYKKIYYCRYYTKQYIYGTDRSISNIAQMHCITKILSSYGTKELDFINLSIWHSRRV